MNQPLDLLPTSTHICLNLSVDNQDMNFNWAYSVFTIFNTITFVMNTNKSNQILDSVQYIYQKYKIFSRKENNWLPAFLKQVFGPLKYITDLSKDLSMFLCTDHYWHLEPENIVSFTARCKSFIN